LVELLAYATCDRKIYVPVVVPNASNDNSNNQGTITTTTDATTTKEEIARLTQKDLDCDGGREILLHRWNNYVRTTTTTTTTTTTSNTDTS